MLIIQCDLQLKQDKKMSEYAVDTVKVVKVIKFLLAE